MKDKIRQYLADLGQEKRIRILLACETGSRAWGFPSPDRIAELTALKSISGEAYQHSGEQELFCFIKDCLERAEREAGNLPSSKGKLSELNEFFIKTLNKV